MREEIILAFVCNMCLNYIESDKEIVETPELKQIREYLKEFEELNRSTIKDYEFEKAVSNVRG